MKSNGGEIKGNNKVRLLFNLPISDSLLGYVKSSLSVTCLWLKKFITAIYFNSVICNDTYKKISEMFQILE